MNLNCYFSEHMHRFWSQSYLSIITKQPTKLKHSRQEARGQANRLRASISLFRIESLVGHTERQRTTSMVCVISQALHGEAGPENCASFLGVPFLPLQPSLAQSP